MRGRIAVAQDGVVGAGDDAAVAHYTRAERRLPGADAGMGDGDGLAHEARVGGGHGEGRWPSAVSGRRRSVSGAFHVTAQYAITQRATSPFSIAAKAALTSSSLIVRDTSSSILSFFCM